MSIQITQAQPEDAAAVATLVGELLHEIMAALEVRTLPLPEFDRTLAFYQRAGFSISGGRKLKRELP